MIKKFKHIISITYIQTKIKILGQMINLDLDLQKYK